MLSMLTNKISYEGFFKGNNEHTGITCENCSKLTTADQNNLIDVVLLSYLFTLSRSGVFIVVLLTQVNADLG